MTLVYVYFEHLGSKLLLKLHINLFFSIFFLNKCMKCRLDPGNMGLVVIQTFSDVMSWSCLKAAKSGC